MKIFLFFCKRGVEPGNRGTMNHRAWPSKYYNINKKTYIYAYSRFAPLYFKAAVIRFIVPQTFFHKNTPLGILIVMREVNYAA